MRQFKANDFEIVTQSGTPIPPIVEPIDASYKAKLVCIEPLEED